MLYRQVGGWVESTAPDRCAIIWSDDYTSEELHKYVGWYERPGASYLRQHHTTRLLNLVYFEVF